MLDWLSELIVPTTNPYAGNYTRSSNGCNYLGKSNICLEDLRDLQKKIRDEEEKTLDYTKQELVNLVKHLILNMED